MLFLLDKVDTVLIVISCEWFSIPFHSLVAVAFNLRDIRKAWESKKQFVWIYVRSFLYIGAIGFIIDDKDKVFTLLSQRVHPLNGMFTVV